MGWPQANKQRKVNNIRVETDCKICRAGLQSGSTLTANGNKNLISPQIFQTMQLTLATPALLFPAISLLILAYTNKFLAIANLIRNLHAKYQQDGQAVVRAQIVHLHKRLNYIRLMQTFAIASFLMCFVCMFLLFEEKLQAATWIFALSLILMIISLAFSLVEIWISAGALSMLLKDFEEEGGR